MDCFGRSANSCTTGLKLHSTVGVDGILRLSLDPVPVRPPGDEDVVVRMEAAPIHPADIVVLLAGADLGTAQLEGASILAVKIPEEAQLAGRERRGMMLEVGLEGAGTVIGAGQMAKHFMGKRVAVQCPQLGAYAEYCTVSVKNCITLPDSVETYQAAGAFTNPLTALAMIETLHLIGEKAVIHTAAASSIGKMLVRLCTAAQISLVNIVRSQEQVEMLRAIGATYVCNSSSPDYMRQLTGALAKTGARVAFDAIGGGYTAFELLSAMEAAATVGKDKFNAYGSAEMKRVYVYGRLDSGPIIIPRGAHGMCWSVEGWASPPILDQVGQTRRQELMRIITDGLQTTFACAYKAEITLLQMLDPSFLREVTSMRTGGKFLLLPHLHLPLTNG